MADELERLKQAFAERYTVQRELGRGGMATVYLAEDVRHRRPVALKVLSPELAQAIGSERFLREITLTAQLDHPHIVPLLDSGEADGRLYYVMPYVEGESLRDRLDREKQLPLDDALQIAREVADALSYAHSHAIVHRDIKPENLLLSAGHVRVADFGIARAVTEAGGESLTSTGLAIGTAAYMSPEQAAGSQDLDGRSDLYSLGCVLYEMLAGHPPFTAPTVESLIHQHLTAQPPSITALRPAVPAPVAAALARAMAKTPADRFPTPSQFARALESGRSPVPPEFTDLRRFRGRRVALAVAAALVALSAAWWGLTSLRPPAAAATMSIAVMPLVNLSGDSADDYFGEGLAEEMTGALAKAGLHVIGRGSTRLLVSRGSDSRDVARELRVATVLEGNVQRAGERVRISVTLTSGADGSVMWNERYDRRLEDIFAIQDEIARSVATQLRATLASGASASLVRQETTDPEAHSLYLRGLYLWNRRTAPSVHQAITLFEQAVARDPNYGRAYAGIALGKAVLPWYDDVNTDEMAEAARGAARRALAIDPTLTEGWAVQGIVNSYQWKNREALGDFARAIALDSTFATTRFWHGLHLVRLGRFEEAYREFARARELEPVSLVIRIGPIIQLVNQRQYREAEALARQLLAEDPTFALARFHLGALLSDAGRFDEAVATLSEMLEVPNVRPSEVQSTLAHALARGGRVAEARRVIDQLRASGGGRLPPTAVLASALMVLGDREAALLVLQAAVEQHDPMIVIYGRAARFDGLRADPRGRALLQATEAH